MGNMMYIVVAGQEGYWKLFWRYRVISFYLMMILITIFSAVRFSSPYVPNYADRNNDTFQRDFGLFCYVWTWTAGIMSQCVAYFMLTDELILTNHGTNRDILGYLSDENFAEAHQCVEFGVRLDSDSVDKNGNVE